MISVKELDFVKAHEQFQQMCEFLDQAHSEGQRVDQVERGLFPQAMTMCLKLLRSFVDAHGDGDQGETLEREGETLDRLPKPHDKRYLSIFGELLIGRWVYGTREKQAIEWSPLDAALGLPVGENSYVLEDWLQRLCIQEAFGESVESLRAWLGTTVSVRTAEHMNRAMSEYVEGFRGEAIPPAEEEGELLVVTADGKGVPMRRTLAARLQAESETREDKTYANGGETETVQGTIPAPEEHVRSSPSTEILTRQQEKDARRPGKKQMAYVGAMYSQARFPRTAEDVIEEVCRRMRAKDRPEPQHKHVWAQMTRFAEGAPLPAAPTLFLDMAVECYMRNPKYEKPCICVMDGERQLWNLAEEWFPRAIGILDLFHAMERLWDVAHCLNAQGSPAAGEFVTHHLRMLLQGKVSYVLRNFRPLLKTLKGEQKKTVQSAITYYENNQEHMRYDEYLAAGYPIASGVAEGACKHLVKDRMERAGMRWELEGAQATLSLRAVYLNGLWDQFIDYRVVTEQMRLYGKDTQAMAA
ncbi:MAG: ISKra4 family transposase [Terrimicrobiaceae bacterium]